MVDKFNKIPEGPQSSYETFSQFFDDKLLLHIVKQSNLYARQKNDHGFQLTVNDLKSFLGILILSGYNKFPRQHMYWESAIDSGVEIVKRTMTYKRFKIIKKILYFNNNANVQEEDKAFKIRPVMNHLNSTFKKYGIFEKNISIDEQMVPYTGHHSIKMFMKNKPIRFGFKQWVMASSGQNYVYSFDLYLGK